MDLIPEELREAHEDANVVFVCGSGVSYDAGLPTFNPLVALVLDDLLPRKPNPKRDSTPFLARNAYTNGKLDEALDILERSKKGGYGAKAVRDCVKGHLDKPFKTLKRHETLARLTDLDTADGKLVTTNFDWGFEKGRNKILRGKPKPITKFTPHISPALPPGKRSSWEGLVYLHGKLNGSPDNRDLVLTAADFGKAYLLDGWARRFMIDLFRDYHVVFIGYSADDPTMSYLVKALAAERETSEHYKPAYAFAPFGGKGSPKTEIEAEQAWEIKGITALTYDSTHNHDTLWDQLDSWARDYREGLTGRQQKVALYGKAPPTRKDDPAISELAWALKKDVVARYFSRLDGSDRPAPTWIPYLNEAGLFALPTTNDVNGDAIKPPLASHILPDHMKLNDATNALSDWIARCLDSQEALDWALSSGAVLHRDLRWSIQWYLKNGGNTGSIPPALSTIWSVLASDEYAHLLSSSSELSRPYPQTPVLSADAQWPMQDFLTRLRPIPLFSVKPDYYRRNEKADPDKPSSWCEIDTKLVGFKDNYEVERFKDKAADWDGAQAAMAENITTLLHEAMEWQAILGMASDDFDYTYVHHPSIFPDEQNRGSRVWTQLIELARSSFDALAARDENAALRLALRWQKLPYPVFRRLALYAATGGHDV